MESVPRAGNGLQKLLGLAPVDLLPQMTDVHINDVCLWIEMVVPDLLQQHRSRHDVTGMAHQEFQDLELARQQRDLPSAAPSGARLEVQLQIGIGKPDRGSIAPAQKRLDSGQKFRKGIGLCQVIIAAALQPPHSVLDAAEGAQEQHGNVDASSTQSGYNRQTIAVRQHAIEHEQVVSPLAGLRFAARSITDAIDGISFPCQRLSNEVTCLDIVLHHKHPRHRTLPPH